MKVFESKTVQVAMIFAGMGFLLIIFDTILGLLVHYQVHFIIEFFGLLGTLFTGIAAKNGVDNYISYRRDTATTIQGLGAPPR